MPSYSASNFDLPHAPLGGAGNTRAGASRSDPLGASAKVKKVMGGRRSTRARGPVEGADGESESDESEGESEREDVFGIGDDDDEPLAKLVK